MADRERWEDDRYDDERGRDRQAQDRQAQDRQAQGRGPRRYGAGDYEQAQGGGRYYERGERVRDYGEDVDRFDRREERHDGRLYGAGGYEQARGLGSYYQEPRGRGEAARFEDVDRVRPAAAGYGRDESRSWLDKAGDEVAAWFGVRGAERRRDGDLHGEGHRGRGPKDYKRSDQRILEDINDRLTDDAWVDASHVMVTVTEGEATLDGTVSNRDAKRRAEDLAERVSGVRHVQNNLRIRPEDEDRSAAVRSGGAAAVGGGD